MASFPTEWSVYDHTLFASYEVHDLQDAPLGMNMLMKLGADGHSLGEYKISLFGGGVMEARYPVEKMLHNCPIEFVGKLITISVTSDQVTPLTNATTIPWRDLDFLLSERMVSITDCNGALIDPVPLIHHLQNLRADKAKNGASVRWAVTASREKKIQLEFQTLPTHSKSLTKANLRGDNTISVLLGSYPVNADLFAGPDPTGPVPLFFAPDREKTAALIYKNQDQLRHDISTVNSQILIMEHLSLEDAYTYLQGKARAAKGVPAFPATSPPPAGPPAKRPRLLQTTPSTSTGKISLSYHIVLYRPNLTLMIRNLYLPKLCCIFSYWYLRILA
jgi:hypothetical protein